MNTTINRSRLLLLLKKEWIENKRQYLLGIIALFLLFNAILLLQFYSKGYGAYNANSFLTMILFCLFALGTGYAIISFRKYQIPESAAFHITLPASAAEKIMVELIKTVVVFNLTFILLFKVTDALYTWIAANHILPIGYEPPDPGLYQEKQVGYFAIFLAVQGLFIYCSLQFRKNAYLIALIIGVAVILSLMKFANTVSLFWKIPDWSFSHPDFKRTYISMGVVSNSDPYIENGFLINTLRALYLFGWGPLFYIAAYFKLKETQVK